MSVDNLTQPSPEHKLFSVYHNRAYRSTQYLLWSPIVPTKEQVIETLDISFEPSVDEFITIEEIEEVNVLELF